MVKRKHLNGKRSRLNERMKPIWPISSGRQMKCICNSSLLGKQRKREVHFWERNTNTFWERCIRTKSTEERYTKNKSTEERCTRKKCTKERYTDTFCAMRPLLHLALLLGWSEITRGWGKVILYFIFIVIIYYALLINRGYISVKATSVSFQVQQQTGKLLFFLEKCQNWDFTAIPLFRRKGS